jgi:hypothetical protein
LQRRCSSIVVERNVNRKPAQTKLSDIFGPFKLRDTSWQDAFAKPIVMTGCRPRSGRGVKQ